MLLIFIESARFELVCPFSLGFHIYKISMNLQPLGAIRWPY